MRSRLSLFTLAAFSLAALLSSFAVALDDDPPALQLRKSAPRTKAPNTASAADATIADDEALKAAGLNSEDGRRLVEYLKQRTLSDAEQGKITGIIKRFAADDFDDRVKATEEIELFGPAAVGPLRMAERDADPEIAYRAKVALKKMAKIPHSAVAAAVVRAIVKLKPEGATGALIGFLPLADDETIAELIREGLVGLAVKDGKADPALINALNDPSAVRRSAAYLALILGGSPSERIRVKDAYPKLKEAVLKESDPEAKFTGLWTLLLTTREKEFLPELLGMIPQLPRGRIWQLEDLLLQLAGSHPKDGRFLKTPESLAKTREAWLNWWNEKKDKVDLVKFDYKPRSLGITDIIEMDNRGYGQGRIISLGPDMKEKWRITGVNDPKDILYISNDRIYVVESNSNQISERTSTGTVVNRWPVLLQPINIQRTPEGGMVVVCRNQIVEFDKDWKSLNSHSRPMHDILAGVRLPKGDVLFVTNAFQGANCIHLDNKLKDTNKTFTFGRIPYLPGMAAIDDDRILVCESDRVAEYDLKTGKSTWKHECNAPNSCQRLFNGNTLIAILNANHLIEVDPSGEIVWEYQAKDGLRVGRAHRR